MTVSSWLRQVPRSFKRITTQGRYRPEIDGLRFFAIAFVLFGHLLERVERATVKLHPLDEVERMLSFLIPKATTGVLLFFTISGYILGMQFLRMSNKHQKFLYFPYLLRRATRIAPPYFLILILGFVALSVVGFKPELTDRGALGLPLAQSLGLSVLFIHGIVLGSMPQTFPPGWSLEVEVHFYIVAPFLFAFMMAPGGTRAAWRKWGVLLASFLAMALLAIIFENSATYYLSLGRFLPFFMLGPFLVLQLGEGGPWRVPCRAADVIGFGALAGLAVTGICQGIATGWIAVTALDLVRLIAISGMFVGAVHGERFRALCSLGWLCVLGGACFSLYLCHLEVMQILTPLLFRLLPQSTLASNYILSCLVQLPIIMVVSLAFYQLVERPFMKTWEWRKLVASWR